MVIARAAPVAIYDLPLSPILKPESCNQLLNEDCTLREIHPHLNPVRRAHGPELVEGLSPQGRRNL